MDYDVRIGDIPQSLLDDIGTDLQHYLAPILGLAVANQHDLLRLIGSGTFVKVDSTYSILTAAHVGDATERFQTIGLALTSYESWFSIPRDVISVRRLRDTTSDEFGPDLALLEIPAVLVERILAHKSVLDLSRQRRIFCTETSQLDSGLWAVTGIAEGLSDVRARPAQHTFEADVHGRAFFCGIQNIRERDGYDYLDAGADMATAGIPPSFGGVSGAGLWQIPLSVDKTGRLSWNRKKNFRGVAFWESAIQEGCRVIRCHGPKSLFDKAWKEWGLPY
jgi:hypothetical protein